MPDSQPSWTGRLRNVLSDLRLRWSALALLTTVIVAFRRPDQFTHPYLWVEDGMFNLPEYVTHGWGMLFEPIAGYFILPVKLIFASSVALSFRWLPEISMLLNLFFTFAVIAAIAFSPTQLRHRYACALAVLLVPSDPEVFGIGLYAGWWGTLLAILPLLWRDPSEKPWLRHLYVVIGGLSTPLIVGLAPVYLIRALATRRRADIAVLLTCLIMVAIQLWALWASSVIQSTGAGPYGVAALLTKFFGFYLHRPPDGIAGNVMPWLGTLLVIGLAAGWWTLPKSERLPYTLLLCTLVIAIVSSITRVPVAVLDPVVAGPRYFFFPFLLISWCLLQLLRNERPAASAFVAIALALPVYNLVSYGSRGNVHYDWRSEVATCVASADRHRFPIHYDGKGDANTWAVQLSGDDCRRLVRDSVLDNQLSD